MKNKKIDAYLISNKSNIQYLSNFNGSNGFMIISKKKKYLFTDSRYILRAKDTIKKDIELIDITNLWKNSDIIKKKLDQLVKKHKIETLGIEEKDLSIKQFKSFKQLFSSKIKYTDTNNFIENIREIKTKTEIGFIKKSQKINEEIFLEIKKIIHKSIKSSIKTEITEKDIMYKIFELSYKLGAETQSFDPIIAFGKNSASPHHLPTNQKLKTKDIILIDMGMKFNGYCSDMTRTLFTVAPNTYEEKIYNLVLNAQNTAINNIKSGIPTKIISKKAQEIFEKEKLQNYFTHALGHGVGLDIHEQPSIHEKDKNTLKENSIITIEPGLYIENKFGVRIEDMILVTKKGHENLTNIDKNLKAQII